MKPRILRFLKAQAIALPGIITDYVTTQIGLSTGRFYEIHSVYNPLNALTIFTCSIALLSYALPDTRKFNLALKLFSALSWLGALNNIIVLLTAGLLHV